MYTRNFYEHLTLVIDFKITLIVNSQQKNTYSKSDFYSKNQFKTVILKVSEIQKYIYILKYITIIQLIISIQGSKFPPHLI